MSTEIKINLEGNVVKFEATCLSNAEAYRMLAVLCKLQTQSQQQAQPLGPNRLLNWLPSRA